MFARLPQTIQIFFIILIGTQFETSPIEIVCVNALASPGKPSRRNSTRNSGSSGRGGFASGQPLTKKREPAQNVAIDVGNDDIAKRAAQNIFSVCTHIQDPALYQPSWADACYQAMNDQGQMVVRVSNDVKKGQLLSLFPIHALGLRFLRSNQDATSNSQKKDTEFIAYDFDRDGDFFSKEENSHNAGFRMRLNIPLEEGQPAAGLVGTKDRVLFSMMDPSRDIVPGWLGGRMKIVSDSNSLHRSPPLFGGNCVTIPLPGAAPLCAVVAMKDIYKGQELVQGLKPPEKKIVDECKSILLKEYESEISELKSYIEMACASTQKVALSKENASEVASSDAKIVDDSIGPFHAINKEYPGLTQLHHNPDIFSVENFLTDEECEKIISKATPHLKPCLVKNEYTGVVEKDPSRTSTNTNLPQSEAPTVVSKLTSLTSCESNQLEILQILHYTEGQEFRPHTDGFEGPTSACGYKESNRLATIFCYLNDVQLGGSTFFPEIDLDIRPKRGMAVIHFPSDIELREDERTLHQGMPAIDEKWLLTTWVWSKDRADPLYDEKHLTLLSSDLI